MAPRASCVCVCVCVCLLSWVVHIHVYVLNKGPRLRVCMCVYVVSTSGKCVQNRFFDLLSRLISIITSNSGKSSCKKNKQKKRFHDGDILETAVLTRTNLLQVVARTRENVSRNDPTENIVYLSPFFLKIWILISTSNKSFRSSVG